MIRTTALAVKSIMGNPDLTGIDVDEYIATASFIVDTNFAGETAVSEVGLTQIEKWMTAHLIAFNALRQVSEEKTDDVSVKYSGKWGEDLKATSYGQTVLQLDITGRLSNPGKRAANTYVIPTNKFQ